MTEGTTPTPETPETPNTDAPAETPAETPATPAETPAAATPAPDAEAPATETPAAETAAPEAPAADAAAAPATPEPATETPAAPIDPTQWVWGLGRRKSSIARVRVRKGSGTVTVNKRPFETYFPRNQDQREALAPMRAAKAEQTFDVHINVKGGGHAGQAGAVRMGLARALVGIEPSYEKKLRDENHLTRDARVKERKKYGRKGARARFQFSKR